MMFYQNPHQPKKARCENLGEAYDRAGRNGFLHPNNEAFVNPLRDDQIVRRSTVEAEIKASLNSFPKALSLTRKVNAQ
jgi:hypothetical protein